MTFLTVSRPFTAADRQAAARRWAERALGSGSTVILAVRAAQVYGEMYELALVSTDGTTLLDTFVRPESPARASDPMQAGAPEIRRVLTDLLTCSFGKTIATYGETTADIVLHDARCAGLDPDHLEDPSTWRSISTAVSDSLGHTDHWVPLPPSRRALADAYAALAAMRGIAETTTRTAAAS